MALAFVAFACVLTVRAPDSFPTWAGIVSRNLTLNNIQLTDEGSCKIANYGMYYATEAGECVAFPIGEAKYLSPGAVAYVQRVCEHLLRVRVACARVSYKA